MPIQLRDYQAESIERIRNQIRAGQKKILFVLPTGGGKTILTGFMLQEAIKRGFNCWFVVHRKELISQSADKFKLFDLECSYIASGMDYDPDCKLQLCMVNTLANRIHKIKERPDLIFIDECHHAICATYERAIRECPMSLQIGLTATPKRLDGKGLKSAFDVMVQGPTMEQLIGQEALTNYVIHAPKNSLNLDGIKTTAGDYNQKETIKRIEEAKIIGDAVKEYRRIADGKKLVVFAQSIEHAEQIAKNYNDAGIPAKAISSKSTAQDRELAINQFHSGEIKILTNCNLVSEGFDVPSCDGIQVFRATKSLAMYLQQCGRALRPDPGNPGKKAVIIDHVKNWEYHGFPCMDHEWKLEYPKRKKKDNTITVKRCPYCFAVTYLAATKCKECGQVFEIEKEEKQKQIDDELVCYDPSNILIRFNSKAEKSAYVQREKHKCKTLADFKSLAIRAGYKPYWGQIQFDLRNRRKNNSGSNNRGAQYRFGKAV